MSSDTDNPLQDLAFFFSLLLIFTSLLMMAFSLCDPAHLLASVFLLFLGFSLLAYSDP